MSRGEEVGVCVALPIEGTGHGRSWHAGGHEEVGRFIVENGTD